MGFLLRGAIWILSAAGLDNLLTGGQGLQVAGAGVRKGVEGLAGGIKSAFDDHAQKSPAGQPNTSSGSGATTGATDTPAQDTSSPNGNSAEENTLDQIWKFLSENKAVSFGGGAALGGLISHLTGGGMVQKVLWGLVTGLAVTLLSKFMVKQEFNSAARGPDTGPAFTHEQTHSASEKRDPLAMIKEDPANRSAHMIGPERSEHLPLIFRPIEDRGPELAYDA